ncbi:nuclease-related domain-containing protein [Mycobacteroides abscessus]|uniref:nuclease-related domain-containing protein n=1 Tax=Desemzia sp. FAM 23989 TaxID=3259523 RepID=UPI0009A8FDAC|nr:Nuclease-related domain [Mycobacteroides abscessus subsp. abscessus]
MIIKKRSKPLTLRVLESLNYRTDLKVLEKKEYSNHTKGFEGETDFDIYPEILPADNLVINDLLLKENGQMFQIDCLILKENTIFLYEIKNYSGSYDYKNGALHGQSDFIISDPLTQVHRSQPLLHNLVRKLGFQMEIKSKVVFINPDFYLYELPRDKPFIFANQLPRHFEQMAKITSVTNVAQSQLANQLCALHIDNYRPLDLPQYDFSVLKKGIICPRCFSFDHINTRQNRICSACGYKETASDAIIRSADECHLLYPGLNVTKRLITLWCGEEYDEQRVQRVLARHSHTHGHYKSTFYELHSPLFIK